MSSTSRLVPSLRRFARNCDSIVHYADSGIPTPNTSKGTGSEFTQKNGRSTLPRLFSGDARRCPASMDDVNGVMNRRRPRQTIGILAMSCSNCLCSGLCTSPVMTLSRLRRRHPSRTHRTSNAGMASASCVVCSVPVACCRSISLRFMLMSGVRLNLESNSCAAIGHPNSGASVSSVKEATARNSNMLAVAPKSCRTL